MKNLFIIIAVASLMACNSAETENPIIIQQGCDTISSDTVDQVDCHPTDSNGVNTDHGPIPGYRYPNGPLPTYEIDSLKNVGELLNYLETIPSVQ